MSASSLSLSLSLSVSLSLPLSLPTLSGHPLVLGVGLVPLVVVATVGPLSQGGAEDTLAAQAVVHHLDEDAGAPTQGPIPVLDQGPIPVPDATGSTLDRGVAPILLTLGRSMDEAETEADLLCPTGEGTRGTG